MLGQCTALAHLELSCKEIGAGRAESLEGVLPQCRELVHINLSDNDDLQFWVKEACRSARAVHCDTAEWSSEEEWDLEDDQTED